MGGGSSSWEIRFYLQVAKTHIDRGDLGVGTLLSASHLIS